MLIENDWKLKKNSKVKYVIYLYTEPYKIKINVNLNYKLSMRITSTIS